MLHRSPHLHDRRLTAVAHCLLLLAVVSTCGCHQGLLYEASALPPEFMAPRRSNLQQVDLSRLSRSHGNSEVLQPGDLVEISVATGIESLEPPKWRGRIGEDGSVKVPLIGSVTVAGMEPPRAEQLIRESGIHRGVFINPNVSLVVVKPRSNRVRVIGAVNRPGTYSLPAANSDVLAAIGEAEGLTPEAGTIIQVQHPPKQMLASAAAAAGHIRLAGFQPNQLVSIPPRTLEIDVEQASLDDGRDYRLEDGSTVMVMQQPKRYFHVIGLVNRSDQYEMPDDADIRVLDAIAMAGNRKLELADKVHVIRQVPGREEPVVIEVSFREAKQNGPSNIRIAPGDVVSVEETPTTFVVGTIREFIRFGFTSSLPTF